jgi:hypothetical protein
MRRWLAIVLGATTLLAAGLCLPMAPGAEPDVRIAAGWERDGSDSATTRAAWVQGRWAIGLRDGGAQRFATTWRLARTAWVRRGMEGRWKDW